MDGWGLAVFSLSLLFSAPVPATRCETCKVSSWSKVRKNKICKKKHKKNTEIHSFPLPLFFFSSSPFRECVVSLCDSSLYCFTWSFLCFFDLIIVYGFQYQNTKKQKKIEICVNNEIDSTSAVSIWTPANLENMHTCIYHLMIRRTRVHPKKITCS